MDVDEWTRTFALMSLGGINDAYTQGNNHNLEIYFDEDGIGYALPWDWDFSYSRASNSALIGDQNLAKVFNLTNNRRLFMGHMQDLMGYNSLDGLYDLPGYNTAYLTSWATYYASLLPGQNWSQELTYINDRSTFVKTQFPASLAFRADYTGPASVNAASISVAGDAWINAKEIHIQGRDEPIVPTWSTLTGWSAIVPLESGANHLVFQAIDFKGNVIGTDTVDVTNTLPIPSQLNDLRITEVMYHPKDETPAYGDNDLEFIELTNIGQSPLPLKNAEISVAASFTLPDIMLNPGQFVLIVGNVEKFRRSTAPACRSSAR